MTPANKKIDYPASMAALLHEGVLQEPPTPIEETIAWIKRRWPDIPPHEYNEGIDLAGRLLRASGEAKAAEAEAMRNYGRAKFGSNALSD